MTDDLMTVQLSGEIDHHNSQKIREDIDGRAQRELPQTLVLDFGGVEFMDSSGSTRGVPCTSAMTVRTFPFLEESRISRLRATPYTASS